MVESTHALATTARCIVVDDQQGLADLFTEWVAEKWECETVYSGEAALEVIDSHTDIVLLDREMPGLSGKEVLRTIRDEEYSVQVMMVSGVEPDVDLIEYPIDDYLQKPVKRPRFQQKIEELLLRRTYHPQVQRYFTAVAKLDLLETTHSESELIGNDDYLALRATADTLRQESDATLGVRSDHVAEFSVAELDD